MLATMNAHLQSSSISELLYAYISHYRILAIVDLIQERCL